MLDKPEAPQGDGEGGKRLNVEIKATCEDPAAVRRALIDANARIVGEDHQIDTYFEVPEGRLKLRRGSIENNLIYYRRQDWAGPKRSDVNLYPVSAPGDLEDLLTAALPVKVVVDKRREIFFIRNVKFHIDRVEDLGEFVEIEAIDRDGSHTAEDLHSQCSFWMEKLGIAEGDLVRESYSDLLLKGGRR